MMSITTLEMEKTRRQTELTALRDRVSSLERRLGEIDAECARLQASLEPAPPTVPSNQPFVLRY
jgi:chromosome segregation ATPase